MAQAKQTPMMRQYQHLKQQYKDSILLFRMGDFYETFGEDAKITSKVLNIALTTRDKKEDPTPLAGFPHHAIDQYLPKLVRAGYKVAVADQMEDPKLAKGIVRRDITRLVTPGTLADYRTDGDKRNNYLAAVYKNKNAYGLALCDISVGEFRTTEIHSISKLANEISRYQPAEILINSKDDMSFLSGFALQPLEDYKFEYEESKKIITDHFKVKNLAALGLQSYKIAAIASGAILQYINTTQKSELDHISHISYYDISGNMILDGTTIRNLDISDSAGEHGNSASLVAILDRTETGMGARLLRRWIISPLLSLKTIQERNAAVEAFFKDPELSQQVKLELKHISDIERLCGKIGLNRANARDLNSLANSIEHVIRTCELISNIKSLSSQSQAISKDKATATEISALIRTSIVDAPPITITDGEIIREGYDAEIDRVREESSGSRAWIKTLESKERERTGITTLKVKFNKVFGYFIEVTNTHKEKVPDNYIRKQTLVNCERFITEELKKKEELVLNAQEILAKMEYECFQKIRTELLDSIGTIQKIARAIAEIDALNSLAEAARLNDYVKPTLHDIGTQNQVICIKNGRHPIVEASSDNEFISNDLEMDAESNRLIILTGPNMSGKSTYIRQVAIIVLMAQIGSFVPASSAEITLVDRIFTRVGASDDLSAGRSTFMVEMDEVANIINNATEHSLIILDEVGRGTSTYDGVSIAWAIAEFLHDKTKARCLFATHYHELLKLETQLTAVKNYNVAVHEENETVIFLRKIEKGGTDKSYGIYVAQMAGIPSDVISRAQEILRGFAQEDMFAVRSQPARKKGTIAESKSSHQTKSDQNQLSFMDNSLVESLPNIFSDLREIDTDTLTPLDALKKIAEWKKRVG